MNYLGEGNSSYTFVQFWALVPGYDGRIRNGFLGVGINVSDIGTAIESGIQAGGKKYLVLAVCLISSICSFNLRRYDS